MQEMTNAVEGGGKFPLTPAPLFIKLQSNTALVRPAPPGVSRHGRHNSTIHALAAAWPSAEFTFVFRAPVGPPGLGSWPIKSMR